LLASPGVIRQRERTVTQVTGKYPNKVGSSGWIRAESLRERRDGLKTISATDFRPWLIQAA
jgi:hypothetical protein